MVDIAAAREQALSVRKGDRAEAAAMAGVLARAFFDDPVFTWVLRGDMRRMRVLRRGFELFLRRVWLDEQQTYTTAAHGRSRGLGAARRVETERRRSAAPAAGDSQSLRQALAACAALARRAGSRPPGRARAPAALLPGLPRRRPALAGSRARQRAAGAGAGRCDRERAPAYLEASPRATARSTNAKASRSPRSSSSPVPHRRNGACGESLGEPLRRSKLRKDCASCARTQQATQGLTIGTSRITVRQRQGAALGAIRRDVCGGRTGGDNSPAQLVLVSGRPWRGQRPRAGRPAGSEDEWRPHDWKDSATAVGAILAAVPSWRCRYRRRARDDELTVDLQQHP